MTSKKGRLLRGPVETGSRVREVEDPSTINLACSTTLIHRRRLESAAPRASIPPGAADGGA